MAEIRILWEKGMAKDKEKNLNDVTHVNDTALIRHMTSGHVEINKGEYRFYPEEGVSTAVNLLSNDLKYTGGKITMLGSSMLHALNDMVIRNGNQYPFDFTLVGLYQEMIHDYTRRPSPDMQNYMRSELDKMMMTKVIIDPTEEYRKSHRIGDYTVTRIERMVLQVEHVTLRHVTNGRTADAYRLFAPMVIFEYGENTNKIIVYPSSLLQIYKPGNYVVDTMYINRYLVTAVVKMQDGELNIPYEGERGMFTEFGFPGDEKDWPSKKKRLRKSIRDILQAFKNEHFIDDFEEYREDFSESRRKPYVGVTIWKHDAVAETQ